MTLPDPAVIGSWHAHIYYDSQPAMDRALALRDKIAQALEQYSIRRITSKEVREHILCDTKANLNGIVNVLKSLGYEKKRKAKKLGLTFETLYEHPDRIVDFDAKAWAIRDLTD